jgi:uncharacterized cupredoxin-like copper-binding protein
MRKAALAGAALAMAVLAVTASAQAAGGAGGGNVNVSLKEFVVTPKPTSIAAGKVTFKVKNTGSLEHELVVLKTNTAPGKLKVKNSKAVETGKVGQVGPLKPGKSGTLAKTLAKGKYVLLCNVKGHYQAKQYIGFVVK